MGFLNIVFSNTKQRLTLKLVVLCLHLCAVWLLCLESELFVLVSKSRFYCE